MFFSSLKTLFARVVIFSLQVRCSNVKMSTTIVKRCFHPMIILPYACYQSVTNTVWASLAKVERGDCGDALCCASPSSCSHKPSPSCQGDASVPTPHNPSPAPTNTKRLPRGCHTMAHNLQSRGHRSPGTEALPRQCQTMATCESSSPAPPLVEVGADDERAEVTFYSDLGPPG